MAVTSANGYTANDITLTEVMPVPGTKVRLRVRRGDCGYLLTRLAGQFDDRVEDIDRAGSYLADAEPSILGGEPSKVFDDWGYAERPVRGSTTVLSSHASGTAVDLNATQHPRGVRNTFTAKQRVEVERILLDYVDDVTGRCVIRWGEKYVTAPVDGMHFEIDAGPQAVARVAARLREEDELMGALEKIEAMLEKRLQEHREQVVDDVRDLLVAEKLVPNLRQPWETEQLPPRSITAVLADLEKGADPRPATPDGAAPPKP